MRQYTKDTMDMAKQRIIGTFIGAAYGLAVLLVINCFESVNVMAVYCACSLMIIPIIYTTVLLDKKNASFGSVEGEYDIFIDYDGGNSAVKTLKKLYEK